MAACEGPPIPKPGFELFHRGDAHLDIANLRGRGNDRGYNLSGRGRFAFGKTRHKKQINKKYVAAQPI